MGSLNRLAEKLYNEPHIITQGKLDQLVAYTKARDLNDRSVLATLKAEQELINEQAKLEGSYFPSELTIENRIATISIKGATTYEASMFDALCGMISYESIMQQIDSLVYRKDEFDLLVAVIDSPGGQAYRAFETGRNIREALESNNIKSVAYVDGLACSAGYVLASAFGEIISNPDSEAGSIGVRVALRENPDSDIIYITAGENKVPFDKEGKFKPEFIKKIQDGIDKTYLKFVSYVSDMRGLSTDEVKSTEADTYDAEDAKALGLVDQIMTGNEFLAYASRLKENVGSVTENSMFTISSETQITKTEKSEDVVSEVNLEKEEKQLNKPEETMGIKEVLQTEEAKQAMAAELAVKQAELAAEFEAKQAEMQAKLDEATKVLDAQKQAAELAVKQAAEAELAVKTAQVQEQLQGMSFVSEENLEELTNFLVSNEDTSAVVFSVLASASDAIEAAVTTQVSEPSTEVEDPIQEDVKEDSAVMKAIKARKESKKLKL